MVARSTIKLIDEAIIPALFLIIGKMVGLLVVSSIFKFSFALEGPKIFYILPSVHFKNLTDYILAENYSNLAMLTAAATGTVFILIKAHFLHETHIHPKIQAKLIRANLGGLITSSYNLYHQAAIWLLYLWLTVAFLINSSILGITYFQISAIGFLVAANFSWIFALDVQREIELSRQ